MLLKLLAATVTGGAVLAMGSAATASNTVPTTTGGYGTAAVSGATASSVSYTLSTDGATITGAAIVFAGNLTGKTVTAGFNSSNLGSCTLGAHNSGTDTTTATCSGFSQSTASATTLAIAVKQ
jgi:hypothetical protein